MINFTVEVEPIPQARPRFSKFGAYEPKRNTEYKKAVATVARAAMGGREPMTGELSAVIKLYRKYKRCSRRFGDFDNLAKAVTDACNKIVYDDDAQIVRCTVEKYTDKNFPRVEVEISELAD